MAVKNWQGRWDENKNEKNILNRKNTKEEEMGF